MIWRMGRSTLSGSAPRSWTRCSSHTKALASEPLSQFLTGSISITDQIPRPHSFEACESHNPRSLTLIDQSGSTSSVNSCVKRKNEALAMRTFLRWDSMRFRSLKTD
jgi:hypothetical protein